jgi:hypothetical protein
MRLVLASALLLSLAPAGSVASPSPLHLDCDLSGWARVVSEHVRRYPATGAADVYKLVHQGVFGSEHAVPSAAEASRWLADEAAALDLSEKRVDTTPVKEAINPPGTLYRVHLKPFLYGGGDLEELSEAFVKTAGEGSGDLEEFRCAVAAAGAQLGSVARGELAALVDSLVGGTVPAVHHSREYTEAHAPAYRVVSEGYLSGLLLGRR